MADWRRLALGTFVSMLACATASSSAHAFSTKISNVMITDNQQGDLNPLPNVIGFNVVANGFTATGTATQNIGPNAASITLTNLVVFQNGGANGILDSIFVQSDAFAAIGPPSTVTLHLDGDCIKSALGAGMNINGCDVSARGFINNNVNIGAVNAPVAANVAAPVAFAPADLTANPNVGVTMLTDRVTFSLGQNDGFTLPNSATLSVAAPEPSSALLLGVGIAAAGPFHRAARRARR